MSFTTASTDDHNHPNQNLLMWVRYMWEEAHRGRVEQFTIVCSVLWTSAFILLRHAPKSSTMQQSGTEYQAAQAFRVAAFCVSLMDARQTNRNWPRVAGLGYVCLLGLFRTFLAGHQRSTVLFQSVTVSLVLFIVMFTAECLPLLVIDSTYTSDLASLTSTGLIFMSLLVLSFTSREWVAPDYGTVPDGMTVEPSTEETASWTDYWCTFSRMTSLISRARHERVSFEDLNDLPWYCKPNYLLEKAKMLRLQHKTTAKVVFFLVWSDLCFAGAFASLFFISELVIPLGLYGLLEYFRDPKTAIFRPVVWILVMLTGRIFGTIVQQQMAFKSSRAALKTKVALTTEIYDKAMQSKELDHDFLSSIPGRHKRSSTGLLTNLMSSDIRTVMQGRVMIMVIFGGPVGSIFGLIGLYNIVGWPCLVGLAITMLGSPITAWISNQVAIQEELLKDCQDSRVSLTTEYLRSIKIVKYFAWEDAVSEIVNESRAKEQEHLWSISLLSTAMTVVTYSVPTLSLLVVFILYTGLLGKPLTASVAYTTISLLEIVRDNARDFSVISIFVPKIRVSLKRIDRYFAAAVPLEEFPEGNLTIQNATFSRSATAIFKLREISIDFVHEGLNVVVGESGSGKTTLLLSILGETVVESGTVRRPQNVALVTQSPWLQAQSLRSNILFAAVFDPDRYKLVIWACCLDADIEELVEGDMANIGENGQTLSGGQRARVALARALYSEAPLLLLDDIFSSLDSRTAVLIWNRVFCSSLLAKRTVVLVTQISWIPAEGDLVITLQNGEAKCSRNDVERKSRPIEEHDRKLLSDEKGHAPDPEDSDSEWEDESEEDSIDRSITSRFHWLVYLQYFGDFFTVSGTILTVVIYNITELSTNFWLSNWVDTSNDELTRTTYYMTIYVLLCLASSCSDGVAYLAFMRGAWFAARTLHTRLFSSIVNTSIFWLEKTSLGKIMNRLSSDIEDLDQSLSEPLKDFFDELFKVFLMLCAISGIIPLIVVPAILCSIIGVLVGDVYSRSMTIIKPLVSKAEAPVLSRLSETMDGAMIIRARSDVQSAFDEAIRRLLYTSMKAASAQKDCDQWLKFRLNGLSATISICAGICAVYLTGSMSAGLVGFSLTQTSSMSAGILRLVFKLNDLDAVMQSFRRVSDYCKLETEETILGLSPDLDPEPSWPATSIVKFHHATVRYSKDGPDVLKHVSFTFDANQRTAIVGRTGSGKTTIILSLLGFTYLKGGTILFDGMDITRISLKRLRKAISMVPQDPLLFQGTVESNLDPDHSAEISHLRGTLLKCASIGSMKRSDESDSFKGRLSLDTAVSAGGSNFSQGQRQVLSLCRAMVRKTKLMVLDEATSSVDGETDAAIQSLLRAEVSESDVPNRGLITVAHRLQTIMDYDKVIVMGSGKVLEEGKPSELVQKGGVFSDMVKHSG